MIDFLKKYQNVLKIGLLLVVLGLIGKFISTVDFTELQKMLAEAPEAFVGVLLVSFMGMLSASFAWQLCLGEEMRKTKLYEIFMIRHVGEMLSIFNPTSLVAGEGLKIHYLNKKGINKNNSVSSVLLARILVVLSAILLIIVSSMYLVFGLMNSQRMGLFTIGIGIVLVLLGYLLTRFLLHKNLYFAKWVDRLKKKYNWSFLTDSTVNTIYEVNEQLSVYFFDHKWKFIFAFFLCVIHWIFGAAEFYIILKALGKDISLVDAVAIEMGVILFKSVGAVIPGQLGVEDYGNKVMLDVIGIKSNATWLLITLMRRARQLFWLAVAFIFMWLIPRLTKIDIKS